MSIRFSEHFDSKNLGMRAQKKLLGKMATKKIAKVFIDETAGSLLDNLFKVSKEYTGHKKSAEKLMKNLIKTVIKVGILYRNEQFSADELQLAERFKKKFHTVAMTAVSFTEVDFTFDKHFLSKSILECGTMLKQLVERHLTEKSLGRIDHVFQFYGDPEFLEAVFKPNGPYSDILARMVADLDKMIEDGTL